MKEPKTQFGGPYVSLLLYVALCSLLLGLSKRNEELRWVERGELGWADFHGEVSKGSLADAESWVGVTFRGDCLGKRFTLEVHAVFRSDASWVRQEKESKALLRHEQLHFDIAEIHARKLRQALSTVKKPCDGRLETRTSIDLLIKGNQQAMKALHAEYDRETRHGKDDKKQAIWLGRIRSDLETLADFKSPKIVVRGDE